MKDESMRPPEALMAEIRRDLEPVKPAALPAGLALRAALVAMVLSAAIPALIGLRKDAAMLGFGLTWLAWMGQFALALMLVWMAAREGTPARRLPKNLVWLGAAFTWATVVAVSLWTYTMRPGSAPSRASPWVMGAACGAGATLAGTLLVVLFTLFFRRSLTARPAVAGALYGAGAGVAVNAGWRLACPLSTPWHSIGAHGAAIFLTALLGAAAARQISKRVGKPVVGRRVPGSK